MIDHDATSVDGTPFFGRPQPQLDSRPYFGPACLRTLTCQLRLAFQTTVPGPALFAKLEVAHILYETLHFGVRRFYRHI